MVLIDATYKTNVYKLLFVNFVGIGNLGINKLQTFGIANIWISDESENSYIWVIQQLISLVFFELSPLMFVTDNDATLTSTVRKIFPKADCLLYTWHILNNFKKNLRKHFDDNLFDEIIKTMDHFINVRDYDAFNLTITAYKKLASLSLNEENIIKYLESTTTYKACLCEPCVNYNIPCHYMLSAKGPIALSSISKRWLLFPDQDQLDSCFLDKQQKSVLLNQLDDILTIPEVKLFDIKVLERIIEKGCSSGTK
ncbi:9719_t:CDS:2 [Cetraspora pellucida]|uniref:9719_t:CDS:1 n=1 Tax=Cetraspora pellucida TaxID=1433469 RepID=A0A9N9NK42_9GLOM|nr:9719_t:CDS:2 [Cetraspora pellucida]